MSPQEILAEVLSYLSGFRDYDPGTVEQDAAVILDRLASRGFTIVSTTSEGDQISPEDLRTMRERLGLSKRHLALEAGIGEATIASAEQPGSRVRRATREAIAAALDRLASVKSS